jgi:hypothetical protein
VADSTSYAEQQDALAQQLEEGGDIRIEAPHEPEVKPEVYKDVEPLLFRGFLTVSATINGVQFVFKSLNQHEMALLRFMHPDGKATARFWNLFLAYGVFMVDGINVLPDREKHVPKIADMFGELQPAVKNRIIWHISEVNRRASNAVALTECYATERYSRYRWYQLQSLDMTTTAITGIAGTDRLGLNWGQLVWRALNKIEDLNDLQEQTWEHAKFIGSCMAGKGISKVYAQDTERRNKAKAETTARKDKILRQVLLGENPEEAEAKARGAVLVTARTVEELASQLERDLSGKKDWHDLVVDQFSKAKAAEAKARHEELESMARQREREFGGKTLFGGTDMTGLTPAQVHDRLLHRRQLEAENASATPRFPEMHDEKLGRYLERFSSDVDPNAPVTTTDRDTSTALPIVAPTDTGKPFGR